MKIFYSWIIFIFFLQPAYGQTPDTSIQLKEVVISLYPSHPLLLHSTASVAILNSEDFHNLSQTSLLPAFNTVAGVRMEERSPGSYRLAIRGSLLRSPFGIRNIKIYEDEFPLTDAGGNTYLNLLDPSVITSAEILKGPEGSMFGANTGGVILLNPHTTFDSANIAGTVETGSFGLFHEHLSAKKSWKKYSIQVNEAYNKSDGYRRNSELERKYLHIIQGLKYKKGEIKLLLWGSQLHYETPGGLTLLQMETDPRAARLPTKTLPGADEQKAGVFNTTLYAGLSNQLKISSSLSHVLTLFGSVTDFKNPFITNYETRAENTAGIRTYIDFKKTFSFLRLNWNAGYEGMETNSIVSGYTNMKGTKGDLTLKDNLVAAQHLIFSQLTLLFTSRLELDLSLGYNNYSYQYKHNFPVEQTSMAHRKLEPGIMPRAGISYRIIQNLVWRASISKGYSTPTLAEILPSDNVLHIDLRSEYGWNYETGFHFKDLNERVDIDLVGFLFDLRDAIVRRTTDAGEEYFINAGGTQQEGAELQTTIVIIKPAEKGFIRHLEFKTGGAYYHFLFKNYFVDKKDYSGKRLTGIPEYQVNASIKAEFPMKLYLFINYNFTDHIPLSDDNSIYAASYNLLKIKAGWKIKISKKTQLELFTGIDNALNERYSLGNDLNAAGGRYYNPAPTRNYFTGLSIKI